MNFAVTLLAFHSNGSGRVLSISRGDDLNDWGLVGGKVEVGETFEEAIIREAVEEASCHLVEHHFYPIFTAIGRTRLTTTFLATVFGLPPDPELPHTREGQVAWKFPYELCTSTATYRAYNRRLFEQLRIETQLPRPGTCEPNGWNR